MPIVCVKGPLSFCIFIHCTIIYYISPIFMTISQTVADLTNGNKSMKFVIHPSIRQAPLLSRNSTFGRSQRLCTRQLLAQDGAINYQWRQWQQERTHANQVMHYKSLEGGSLSHRSIGRGVTCFATMITTSAPSCCFTSCASSQQCLILPAVGVVIGSGG